MLPDSIGALEAACRDAPPGVLAVYLFGSVAQGRERPASDVDVGVLVADRRPPAAALEGFIDRLEAVGRRRVDLVVVNEASADLFHRILRDGMLLLDRDRRTRLEFEVKRRNEYFDLEPLRRAYRFPRQGAIRS